MKLTTAIAALVIAGATYAEKPVTEKSNNEPVEAVHKGGLFSDETFTKEQRLKIAEIMKADREEMKKEFEKLKVSKGKEKHFDKEAMKAFREKMKVRKESNMNKIKAVMTKEQKEKFEAKLAERKASLPKLKPTEDANKDKE